MKKLILVALIGLSCFTASAGIREADAAVIFRRATSYKDSKIGFDLVNKARRPIWIIVKNGDTIYPKGGESTLELVKSTAAGRKRVQLELDISKPTQLAIWYSHPAGLEGIKTPPNKIYTFDQERTLYLTWDPANYARPQTGPLGGRLGKTDKNLSLKNNVTSEEIHEKSPADFPWLRALLTAVQAK